MSDPDSAARLADVLASARGRAAVRAGRPGAVVRLVRSALGWSQAELGDRIGYSQATVSRLESGRGRIGDVTVLTALAATLDIPPSLLGVAGSPPRPGGGVAASRNPLVSAGTALRLEVTGSREDSVKRSEFLRSAMGVAATVALPRAISDDSTTRVGAATAKECRAALDRLYGLDTAQGGQHVYDLAVHMVRRLQHTLNRATYTPAVGRELQAVLAAASEHVAWSAYDAGRRDVARRWWLEALHAADLAESRDVRVITLASMSLSAAGQRAGREAVDLVAAARRAAGNNGTPRLMSLLAAREALGQANAGAKAAACTALRTARRHLERDGSADEPEWLDFWGDADLASHESRVAWLAGDRRASIRARRDAVAAADPRLGRNVALYTAVLGTLLTRNGELEEAITVSTPVVARSREFGSRRIVDAVNDTRRLLAAHRDYRPAREFVDWSGQILADVPA